MADTDEYLGFSSAYAYSLTIPSAADDTTSHGGGDAM
jgi:hypothetical protein